MPIHGPDSAADLGHSASSAERARMGRVSGILWIVAALVGLVGTFLPGAVHEPLIWVFALAAFVLLYGIGSVTGAIPWQRASIEALAIGMAITIPIAGLGLYLTGASLSYIEPLLFCSLLYAAFYFPPKYAWPLAIELILVAGTPLLYDARAIDNAYAPRYLGLVAGFLAATWVMVGLKQRLLEAEARQRDFANRDPLTGVGNRRKFDATLHRELAQRTGPRGGRRNADGTPLALVTIDLDDFKEVNDRYGHQAGDAVLCEAARRAGSILRSGDTLARIGGDEFAVIVPGASGDGLKRLAEAIRIAIGAEDPERDGPSPRASIGWAVFPDDGEDFSALMHAADQRMLRRKRNGPRLMAQPPVAAEERV